MSIEVNIPIKPWDSEESDDPKTLEVKILNLPIDNRPVTGIDLSFSGYEAKTCPQAGIVYIENRNGVPHVIVWADINSDDPTHVISLEGARVKEVGDA
jgi:hypothetical protein